MKTLIKLNKIDEANSTIVHARNNKIAAGAFYNRNKIIELKDTSNTDSTNNDVSPNYLAKLKSLYDREQF